MQIPPLLSRRRFLTKAETGLIGGGLLASAAFEITSCAAAKPDSASSGAPAVPPAHEQVPPQGPLKPIVLPPLSADTEQEHSGPPQLERVSERVGYAVVGLGTLSLTQILPAIVGCKHSRLVALVSGSPDKARTVAQQYGIDAGSIYDYASFDRIADNPQIQVVYIVLPNGLHAEYTIRAARAGKHVLCEKPMANTVRECEAMIAACAAARRYLMVAYRLQYEPHHRMLIDLARNKDLGTMRMISAANGQNLGDPRQWRLDKGLAGGGSLMDVGIYCLNAARYVTGEEPIEVAGRIATDANDKRFTQVEDSVAFTLRFPSGVMASCSCGYGNHEYRSLSVMGSTGWAEMDHAFTYSGLRLRTARAHGKQELVTERSFEPTNQFATEMDHMSVSITHDRQPYTGGLEGLQDMRLIADIYRSAASGGHPIAVSPPSSATHGAFTSRFESGPAAWGRSHVI
jgi:predicted dehydrogenase